MGTTMTNFLNNDTSTNFPSMPRDSENGSFVSKLTFPIVAYCSKNFSRSIPAFTVSCDFFRVAGSIIATAIIWKMSAEKKVTVANLLERFMNQESTAVPKSPINAKNSISMNCAAKNPPSSRSPKIPAMITIGLKLPEILPRKKNGMAITKAITPVTTKVSSPNKIASSKTPFGFLSMGTGLDSFNKLEFSFI